MLLPDDHTVNFECEVTGIGCYLFCIIIHSFMCVGVPVRMDGECRHDHTHSWMNGMMIHPSSSSFIRTGAHSFATARVNECKPGREWGRDEKNLDSRVANSLARSNATLLRCERNEIGRESQWVSEPNHECPPSCRQPSDSHETIMIGGMDWRLGLTLQSSPNEWELEVGPNRKGERIGKDWD